MTRHVVARADEIGPGGRKIVTAGGRRIAVFNLAGEYFALLDRCPHLGGPLGRGALMGDIAAAAPGALRRSRPGEFVRCPWHGWEFEIRTGKSRCDPDRVVAPSWPATLASGGELVAGPLWAESFPVSLEHDFVVVEM